MTTSRAGSLWRLGLAAAATLWAATAQASRVQGPMGRPVREADTIVVADTQAGGPRGHQTVLHVREVLKGDAGLVGKPIVLAAGPRSTADARVPRGAKGIAVLLGPGWQDAQAWPVLEVYTKPEEIQALRTLAEVYRPPTERERLLALWKVFPGGDPICQEQLFADLRDMREPANFDLFARFYPELSPPHQERLVGLIADIGDLRGVPILLDALGSPHPRVGERAARALAWAFPGAPGVTEAFEKALEREHLARQAARYLAKRRPGLELEGAPPERETPWTKARRLMEGGQREAARAVYRQILEDEGAWTVRRAQAARALLKDATREEREQLREAVVRLAAREPEPGDAGFAEQAAQALRTLRHPDCLNALLGLLERQSALDRRAVLIATMAIRELGPAARREATIKVIDRLAEPPPGIAGGGPRRALLPLVWLGDTAGFDQAALVMHAGYRPAWQALGPLRALAQCEDEGALLARLLSGDTGLPPKEPNLPVVAAQEGGMVTVTVRPAPRGPNLPSEALEWVAFRLGDLRDPRAVPQLAHHMAKYSSWLSGGTAADSLIAIGGPQVEAEMTRLLTPDESGYVPRNAVRVLFAVLGDGALPLARRMLVEERFGDRRLALEQIGRIGAPGDIALVRPFCDYWTADRRLHHAAMAAAAALRERHNYDLNGPIRPRGGE